MVGPACFRHNPRMSASPELPLAGEDDREAALGLVRAGRVLAVALLASSVWRGVEALSAGARALPLAVFGVAALALWGAATVAQKRLLLGGRLRAEVARGNLAAALAAAGN